MNNKILIIGKNGFISSNLYEFFKKNKISSDCISFEKFFYKNKNYISTYTTIINCATNYNFVKKKYQKKFDFNLQIANKIYNYQNIKFVILSTRKVYKSRFNISEFGNINPKCNYSKNSYKSEIETKKIIPKQRLIILRISNLIGLHKFTKRKIHENFVFNFFKYAKSGLLVDTKNYYKDFLGVNKFSEIVYKLVKIKKCYGIFNVSIGKKIYLSKIVQWLNYYNKKKLKIVNSFKNYNTDNFTLNNKKLMNTLSIKNTINDLKLECLQVSKNFFLKK